MTMQKNSFQRRIFMPLLAAGLAVPGLLAAEPVLFQDRFDGTAAGEQPDVPPWTAVNEGPNGENIVRVRDDANDYFGQGTGNRYVEITGNSGATALWAEDVLAEGPDHEVITLSFDFYEPDGGKSDPLILFVYNGPVASDARVERLRLTHGGTGASAPAPESRVYQLDTVNQLDWVVNNSTEVVKYLNGTRELGPGLSDIWINGRLVLSDYSYENVEAPGPIRGFTIGTFTNTPSVETYFDDIQLLAGATVRFPESMATPLIEFLFEGDLTNTGTLGGEGTFVHEREEDPAYNWEWQNRASIGEGLGGRSGSGLDNTQVGGMGDYGQGGSVREGGFFFPQGGGLHDLQSITIAGWYRTPADTFWSSGAFMVGWPNSIDYLHQTGTGERVYLSVPYPADGSLVVRRQFSLHTTVDDTAIWQQFPDRWTFQAVTFDGTTGRMSFYYGYDDSTGVTHNVTRENMDIAPLRNLGVDVAFANSYFGSRPLKAQLDSVRIFGSTEDGSGALSHEAISRLWADDLAAAFGPDTLEVRVVDIEHDGASFIVSFETDAGATYTIERSDDLVNWEAIHIVTGDGSIQSYSDPAAGVERRFYRVRADN